MPDLVGVLGKADPFDLASGLAVVVEADLDAGRGLGEQREIRPAPVPARSERVGEARADLHGPSLDARGRMDTVTRDLGEPR